VPCQWPMLWKPAKHNELIIIIIIIGQILDWLTTGMTILIPKNETLTDQRITDL
jgi:cytochrome c biogenesis protein ResB